jgi:O-antigen/teichoic acid export membrane protein
MSTKRLAIRSVLSNWIGFGCLFLLTLIVTPIVVNGLGKATYGLWAIVVSLTSYTDLIDMGFRAGGVKFIAQYHAVGDHRAVNRVLNTTLVVNLVLATGAFLIVLSVAMLAPYVFDLAGYSAAEFRWAVIICGFDVAISILGEGFGATLPALTRFDLVMLLVVASRCLIAAAIVLILHLGGGLLEMAFAVLGVGLVRQFCQYQLARRLLNGVHLSKRHFDREMLGTLFNFSLLHVFIQGANKLTTHLCPLLTGAVLGPVSVTYFTISESLVRQSGKITKAIGMVTMPVASRLDSQERSAELVRMLVIVSRSLLSLSLLIVIVTIGMGRQFVDFWLGAGYSDDVYPVLCVLVVAGGLMTTMLGLRQMLVGMGQLRFLSYLAIVEILIVVGPGVLLLQQYGVIGIAWAVLAAKVATSGIGLPAFGCRRLKIPLSRFIAQVIPAGILATLGGLVLTWLLVVKLPARSLTELILQMAVVSLVTVLCIFYVCLDASLRSAAFNALRWNHAGEPDE